MNNPQGLGRPPSGRTPKFSLELEGDWSLDQQAFACALCAQLERTLKDSGYTVDLLSMGRVDVDSQGHSTLIAGNRALLAIGAVVLIALLLHTIFWSFVLPLGAIA